MNRTQLENSLGDDLLDRDYYRNLDWIPQIKWDYKNLSEVQYQNAIKGILDKTQELIGIHAHNWARYRSPYGKMDVVELKNGKFFEIRRIFAKVDPKERWKVPETLFHGHYVKKIGIKKTITFKPLRKKTKIWEEVNLDMIKALARKNKLPIKSY